MSYSALVTCLRYVCIILAITLVQSVWADDFSFQNFIPDNASVRRSWYNRIIQPLDVLAREKTSYETSSFLSAGVKVEVQVKKDKGYTAIAFMNKIDTVYKTKAQGNVEVRREHRPEKTSISEIIMYPDKAASVSVRIRPAGSNASMISVWIMNDGFLLIKDVRVTVPIESFVIMPIFRMMELSASRIAWQEIVWIRNADWFADVSRMSAVIRPLIVKLPDAEDGAMDEEGKLVRIGDGFNTTLSGFNCSGFAKWLADGQYAPIARDKGMYPLYLRIQDLKERHLDLRGNDRVLALEETRDPYFGLDWVRNIATRLALVKAEALINFEARDVRDNTIEPYVEDKGYRLRNVGFVLYLQAIRNPGRWYLASINGPWGSKPVAWQHYHIAAFFPWFDNNGVFHLDVYERNNVSSLGDLLARYADTWAHLVWISAEGDFEPPSF